MPVAADVLASYPSPSAQPAHLRDTATRIETNTLHKYHFILPSLTQSLLIPPPPHISLQMPISINPWNLSCWDSTCPHILYHWKVQWNEGFYCDWWKRMKRKRKVQETEKMIKRMKMEMRCGFKLAFEKIKEIGMGMATDCEGVEIRVLLWRFSRTMKWLGMNRFTPNWTLSKLNCTEIRGRNCRYLD